MEELAVVIARIDERTKHIKDAQEKHIADTAIVLTSHDKRIRKNESMVSKVAVAFSFIGVVTASGVSVLWNKFLG